VNIPEEVRLRGTIASPPAAHPNPTRKGILLAPNVSITAIYVPETQLADSP
jgi:hypothetical protein